MSEPIYIRQTAEEDNLKDVRLWFDCCAKEAVSEGCGYFRFSLDNINAPTMAIVEGWEKQPENEGDIRWAVTL